MPFYDYKCDKCGKKFEVMHGMSGKPAGLKCDYCSSSDVQRIFHAVRTMRKGNVLEMPVSGSGGHSCGSCSSRSCGSCH